MNTEVPRYPDPVTYTAVLPIGESTIAFLAALIPAAHRGSGDPAEET